MAAKARGLSATLLIWCLVILLDIPMSLWCQIPKSQRLKTEMKLITEFCQKDKENSSVWKIERRIENWNYQLIITPVERRL